MLIGNVSFPRNGPLPLPQVTPRAHLLLRPREGHIDLVRVFKKWGKWIIKIFYPALFFVYNKKKKRNEILYCICKLYKFKWSSGWCVLLSRCCLDVPTLPFGAEIVGWLLLFLGIFSFAKNVVVSQLNECDWIGVCDVILVLLTAKAHNCRQRALGWASGFSLSSISLAKSVWSCHCTPMSHLRTFVQLTTASMTFGPLSWGEPRIRFRCFLKVRQQSINRIIARFEPASALALYLHATTDRHVAAPLL